VRRYLVADLFCGAGGSSTGAMKAIRQIGGEMELVAVNHWPVAIETHQRNHPAARHYVADVTAANPTEVVPGGRLDLLMASPECTFHSNARGGKPIHDQGRMDPWALQRWVTRLDVACILVENVPEFRKWGPLCTLAAGHQGAHSVVRPSSTPELCGRPDPAHKGQYFEAWIRSFWELGYTVDWRLLNAANFGDVTTRTRFFMQARKDGVPIRWPEPSHSRSGAKNMLDHRPRWRAAREIIDWLNPGRSLLDDPKYRKRPLSEKTRRRIARGLERFGGPLAPLYIALLGLSGSDSSPSSDGAKPEPFISCDRNHVAPRSIELPVPTITTLTGGGISVVFPEAFIIGQGSNAAPRSAEDPIPTVVAIARIAAVEPFITKYYKTAMGAKPVEEPLDTVTTKDRFGLANPLVVPYGPRAEARDADEPLPTIMTKDRLGVAVPTADPFIVPQFGERAGQTPRVHDVGEPVPAVTSHGAGALVEPVLVDTSDGSDGPHGRVRSADDPLATVTTRPRLGLAEPVLVDVNHGDTNGADGRSQSIDDPLGTVTTHRGVGLAEPVLVQTDQTGSNGSCSRSVEEPVPTVVTKQNVALVEPVIRQIESGQLDPRRLVLIDGALYLLDIRFRMLTNRELARAMGFSDDEAEYEFTGNISEVTKQIGNAVPVNTAAALVKAILGPVDVGVVEMAAS